MLVDRRVLGVDVPVSNLPCAPFTSFLADLLRLASQRTALIGEHVAFTSCGTYLRLMDTLLRDETGRDDTLASDRMRHKLPTRVPLQIGCLRWVPWELAA